MMSAKMLKHIVLAVTAAFLVLTPELSIANGALNLLRARNPVASFTPGAFHFDNLSQQVTTSALTVGGTGVPDTSKLTCSYWIRGTNFNNNTTSDHQQTTGNMDFVSNFDTGLNSEANPGTDFVIDSNGGAPAVNALRVNFSDNSNNHGNYTSISSVDTSEWSHYLISVDASVNGNVNKYAAVYINGVKQGSGGISATSAPFSIHVSNSGGWGIANQILSNSFISEVDFSEVFCDFTTTIVDSSNNISAANIAKFYSAGKPVNLGANGSTPFGHQPELYFSGGASAAGTNLGTVTNTFTATSITDAAYGPAGPPSNEAYYRIGYGGGASGTTVTTVNATQTTVKAGDLIVQALVLSDNANNVNHSIQVPSGYTSIVNTGASSGSNAPPNARVIYKFAASDNESTAVTWNWTTAPTRTGAYATYVIGGVDQTTPIDSGSGWQWQGANSNVTSFTAPNITTNSANELVLTLGMSWSQNQRFNIPASTMRFHQNGQVNVNGNYVVTSGTTFTGQTMTGSVGDSAFLATIGIRH